ncbi:PRAME family member 8-like [Dipodomys spectabilis]|uniref:PRAME family member 8-like n=1 Tax=Dipodomys spectabilis TaxID=105255 RepID=UPI001C5390BF|nr:PRAME family member 8-like [Dipodomys spectabilis]
MWNMIQAAVTTARMLCGEEPDCSHSYSPGDPLDKAEIPSGSSGWSFRTEQMLLSDWTLGVGQGSSTLSTMSLPTLRQLAMQSLLEDQALAISALDVLPLDLFSTLFREVVAKRRMEVLKAMVQAWPFACLPLGALVGSVDLEILQVTLEGLDVLLEQGAGPRCKLQVLNLQNMSLNIWTSGYIAMSQACSAAALTDKPAANHCAALREEPPFRIFMDVTISDGPWDCVLAHVLRWVETRRDQVQLCSKKLQVLFASTSGSTSQIQSTLGVLHLDSIQELVVDDFWHHKTLESMVPYLTQMKNLRKLSLAKMKMECCSCVVVNLHRYLSQNLLQGNHQVNEREGFFPHENLEKVFRTLKPLTTLSLISSPLNEADLRCLSLCPSTSQLKYLRLRTIYLGQWSPGPLRALLERVSGTLEALALEHCGITEAQLSAILPALSQCSQLSFFSIYGNRMSLAALQNLLSHTARLRPLQRGLYPAPVESYDHECLLYGCRVNRERFAQCQDGDVGCSTHHGLLCPVFSKRNLSGVHSAWEEQERISVS